VTRAVLVHGVGQQLKGPRELLDEWGPALLDGVAAAGGDVGIGDLACAFYGGLFRPKGFVRRLVP